MRPFQEFCQPGSSIGSLKLTMVGIFFNPPKLTNGGIELLPLSNGLHLFTRTLLFVY